LILQFLALSLFAEQPSYKIFTTEEGLPHDSVNEIVRDSRGFLWFCTSEGLSRFDGRSFTNFTQEQGLPHRNVTTFFELRDGTYLIGTSGGLVVFNPKGRAYRWNVLESRLEKDSDEPPMFQTFAPKTDNRIKKAVSVLIEEDDGTILVGTSLGLFRVKREDNNWQFTEIEVEKELNIGYHAFLRDSQGGIVIAASSGVYRIFEGRVETVDKPGAGSLMQDRDGKIWVGASGDPVGLRIFEFEGKRLKLIQTYKKSDGTLNDTFQNSIKQLPDGRVFIGQANGLQEFRPHTKGEDYKLRFLKDYFVSSITEDSTGKLWVGTELKGAWQISPSGFVTFGEETGIPESEDIRAIYTNPDGEIILPSRTRGVSLALKSDGKFEAATPFGVKERSWGWNFLDLQAQDGEWWIPAFDGLYRYPKVKSYADLARTPPKKVYTKADGLWSNQIFNLFEDSRGDIWITTVDGGENTVARWERKTDKIYAYSSEDGLLKNNGPISFAEDFRGNIWFGHYFGKLARYRDGKFEIFSIEDGLPESQIGDLLTDSTGRLWIATAGHGIFRIDDTDAEKPVFISLSMQNGLSSNQVICLTEDKFKRIYAGTGRGINRIDRNGIIRVLTQADGLPGNYITRCAADKKGDLWFVSQNILVRLTPEIEKNIIPPPVFIDKFSVNGVAQKISVLGETDINLPDFAANQTQIEISFFALTFGAGENIRYQYRLNEQDWSNPGNRQTLNLNLGAGNHNFEVRAVRSDGVVSEKSATVSFKILPPIYLRWWFISLCLLSLGLIVFSFYRYRVSNLKAINEALTEAKKAEEQLSNSRAERLAELEKVRSRIATDLHDDIGASLTQIAILSEVAQAQSKGNGASESLSKITNVSNELVGTMSDIVWSINPSKDHLSDLTQRMRRFASDSLSAKGITFQFNSSEIGQEVVVKSHLRREVFLIFKESINNIVKHSEAAHVEIKLQISDEFLTLKIVDDGTGFDSEKAYENSLSSISMGKNGILSMQKRAEEINGELVITSQIGKGTTIELRLPMEIGQTQAPNR
jgi:signal transduction histidine kinase/ligand-binding sensor domain-containing protein